MNKIQSLNFGILYLYTFVTKLKNVIKTFFQCKNNLNVHLIVLTHIFMFFSATNF